jgi:hypothetical protein
MYHLHILELRRCLDLRGTHVHLNSDSKTNLYKLSFIQTTHSLDYLKLLVCYDGRIRSIPCQFQPQLDGRCGPAGPCGVVGGGPAFAVGCHSGSTSTSTTGSISLSSSCSIAAISRCDEEQTKAVPSMTSGSPPSSSSPAACPQASLVGGGTLGAGMRTSTVIPSNSSLPCRMVTARGCE